MTSTQGYAGVFLRGRKLFIETASVYNAFRETPALWGGIVVADTEAFSRLLDIDDPTSVIGATLRNAFLTSRIRRGRYPGQPARGKSLDFASWDLALAAQLGLRSTRSLAQGLRSCKASLVGNVIKLTPLKRGRGVVFWEYGSAWRDQHPEVLAGFNVSDDDLGQALKDCLAHCA